jgi:hypothetical protein
LHISTEDIRLDIAVVEHGINFAESPEDRLRRSDSCARALGIPRAEYIRRALERMNAEAETHARAERMARAYREVRRESMRVNAQFARIERAPDA